ncbi:hypothetical protein RirG_015240 [Rhizophagus irregularis DAOM 197198w]|uniref:F-box domain-containing protein n=1 Tax=Rhizophagus irregularis (strain DAOM 197198w) TaxID=1432141 RepID=A0A015LFG0_RHIIW|nr:hypothetical protein RirG_015240 [Rhizophagus irregularis DAOM 197198w]
MLHIAEDCLQIIINELQYDLSSLYSCILVNRYWCRIAIPILWKNPSSLKGFSPSKLHNMIIFLLPKSSKKFLSDNIPEFSLTEIPYDKPLFNYISFFTQISPDLISSISQSLVNSKGYNDEKWIAEKYEKYVLEQEFYELFINNCKGLKLFYWNTSHPLFKYQGATTCFSQLCTLIINLMFLTIANLFDMTQICQNIKHLEVIECKGNIIVGLVNFIEIQRNLQSLSIDFFHEERSDIFEFIPLSSIIMKKASTLKKFIIRPFIGLLSPKILTSLINLQHLELINDMDFNMLFEGYTVEAWDEYLSITSFPNLEYLKIHDYYLPSFIKDYMLIEKSNGNILEINILKMKVHDPIYTKKLIITISKCCPKIKRFTIINIEPENFEDLKEIFLNCTQLEMLALLDSKEHNGDKLLEIISDYSPETLCEYSFNLIFTIEGLEIFFENWKKRKSPLILNIIKLRYNGSFTEHDKIIKKYFDEGVIKEYNYHDFRSF